MPQVNIVKQRVDRSVLQSNAESTLTAGSPATPVIWFDLERTERRTDRRIYKLEDG